MAVCVQNSGILLVAFLTDDGIIEAIALIRRLKNWADEQSVQLRLTAHTGLVSAIEGADGRTQLVGDGINLCGSLVNFGFPQAVVVTSAFRDHLNLMTEKKVSLPAVNFSDERVVYLKHFAAHNLCLLSFIDDSARDWFFEHSDKKKIEEATEKYNLWQMIYHMKRMLQINSKDPLALKILNKLEPGSLMYIPKSRRLIHPLLGVLPRRALLKLLMASELIEREDGDIICKRNETGDSLFIVLKGEIGVITKSQIDESGRSKPTDIRIREGGIVGELALALDRPRTATLQVVGPTALLTINYRSLNTLLKRESRKSVLRRSFENFLEERTLEHICRHAQYLKLPHYETQEFDNLEPWDRLIDGVETYTIYSENVQQLSFGTVAKLPDYGSIDLSRNGLYILASGEIHEAFSSSNINKKLSGNDFDILFASIPGEIVSVDRKYKLAPGKRITVIWISNRALADYAQDQYQDIIDLIRKRLSHQMLFDAFISYASENVEVANLWKNELGKADLDIFMKAPEHLNSFEKEIDFALAESRVLVPIVSRAAKDAEWVKKEIAKRKKIFDENNANILPIETKPNLAQEMAVGFTPVYAGESGSESESINLVIELIRAVKNGDKPGPFLQ
jgi:hypothetical protein